MEKRIDFKAETLLTSKREKAYIKELENAYKLALKDINNNLAQFERLYGKLDMETMQQMSNIKLKSGRIVSMTRLERLNRVIQADLAIVLANGQQKTSSYLTDVYFINRLGGIKAVQKLIDFSFEVINRETVYQSAINPLAKLSIQNSEARVKQKIKMSITQSIVQGESIRDMGKRVQVDLETNANDATRIVRTETTGMENKARQELMNEAVDNDIPLLKEWISTSDSRVRDSHSHLNGKTAEYDEPFSNGLMYPGDQDSGKASETINCRCSMGYVVTEEDIAEARKNK